MQIKAFCVLVLVMLTKNASGHAIVTRNVVNQNMINQQSNKETEKMIDLESKKEDQKMIALRHLTATCQDYKIVKKLIPTKETYENACENMIKAMKDLRIVFEQKDSKGYKYIENMQGDNTTLLSYVRRKDCKWYFCMLTKNKTYKKQRFDTVNLYSVTKNNVGCYFDRVKRVLNIFGTVEQNKYKHEEHHVYTSYDCGFYHTMHSEFDFLHKTMCNNVYQKMHDLLSTKIFVNYDIISAFTQKQIMSICKMMYIMSLPHNSTCDIDDKAYLKCKQTLQKMCTKESKNTEQLAKKCTRQLKNATHR